MKVHLIRKETITGFARQNAQSRVYFSAWLTKIKYADWSHLQIYRLLSRALISWGMVHTGPFLILGEINTG